MRRSLLEDCFREKFYLTINSGADFTAQPLYVAIFIAVREEPALHPELYQCDGTDGMRLPWNFLVDVVSESCQEVFTVCKST